jgi:hypothetical protein
MQPQRSSQRLSKAKEANSSEKQQERKKKTRMNSAKQPLRKGARMNLRGMLVIRINVSLLYKFFR